MTIRSIAAVSAVLVMTLPASLAQTAAGMGRFAALPPPLDLGRFTMSLFWHARRQDEPRHVWLRHTVVAAAAELKAAARGAKKESARRKDGA